MNFGRIWLEEFGEECLMKIRFDEQTRFLKIGNNMKIQKLKIKT